MKKDSKESIERQIEHYDAKHRMLDDELSAEERRRVPNALQVRRIKKLKLMCKDKVSELSRQLKVLMTPRRPPADVIPLPTPQPAIVPQPIRRAVGE